MKENKKVILIIEDEGALLDTYGEILDEAGYEAMKASDGHKGLDILATNKDVIDLVLLDLMMPGIDGLDVMKLIREDKGKYGSAPIVILTNLSNERIIKEAFSRGANGYLMKVELDPEKIVEEINSVLKK
jgi:CheY-like chemotaxis protein